MPGTSKASCDFGSCAGLMTVTAANGYSRASDFDHLKLDHSHRLSHQRLPSTSCELAEPLHRPQQRSGRKCDEGFQRAPYGSPRFLCLGSGRWAEAGYHAIAPRLFRALHGNWVPNHVRLTSQHGYFFFLTNPPKSIKSCMFGAKRTPTHG